MLNLVEIKEEKQILELIELANIIWNEFYPSIITREQIKYMLDMFHSYENILDQINNKNYHYYFINDGNNIGYISYQLEDKNLFLSKFYLLENSRGKGYFKMLLNNIINEAKKNKKEKVTLTVNKNNNIAIRAYEKNNFKIYKEEKVFIGNNYYMDDYFMELNIND